MNNKRLTILKEVRS